MRVIVQRVLEANVKVDGKIVGEIDKGLLVFLGVHGDDDQQDLDYIAKKIIGLRIFEDENEKMNLSIGDIDGEILIISQFTLYGDCRKGNRPSFTQGAGHEMANEYYEKMVTLLRQKCRKVQCGIFAADMKVSLINDGPVTIQLDSTKIY